MAVATAPPRLVYLSLLAADVHHGHATGIYLYRSTDGGATYLRASTQSFDPTLDGIMSGKQVRFLGDYQGLSAGAQTLHLLWNDTREGTAAAPAIHLYSAAVPLRLLTAAMPHALRTAAPPPSRRRPAPPPARTSAPVNSRTAPSF